MIMKNIFTLMLSVTLVSVAFAQHGNNDFYRGKKYDHGKPGYSKNFDMQRRNDMIAKVNHEYDQRIYWVKESRMRLRDKKREIARLENERKDRLRMIYARFDKKGPNPHWKDGYVIH
ncbi:MAG: hypothetical protein BGP13_19675 [Sphingobacteriales bacterium 40-81]|nr:MAG: hypothetical protein BGP13_19675 [Sphingobacteriales bacterium 40-81]